MVQKTVVISINAAWNIVNFRRGLIKALQEAGYEVVALAPPDAYAERLDALGVRFIPIEMDKKGVSPLQDARLFWRYLKALRGLRPDVFLGYTAKPNVYGSLACHVLGIPVINNVAGLGTAFIRKGLLTRIVTSLYRAAFRGSRTVFFQNEEDLEDFVAQGIVRASKARLLPGSGISLSHFEARPRADTGGAVTFLLVARLLWDKGVGEFVEAARLVRRDVPDARFQILGFLDVENRTAVPRTDVEAWVAEGTIEYLGSSDDVRPFIEAADCVVLPSYREGLPRVLLEGSAMARPLIATDVPGCRQVVRDGENGFLCRVRDSEALAEAMGKMIAIGASGRRSLGAAARQLVEREFDERIVAERYLSAVAEAIAN